MSHIRTAMYDNELNEAREEFARDRNIPVEDAPDALTLFFDLLPRVPQYDLLPEVIPEEREHQND